MMRFHVLGSLRDRLQAEDNDLPAVKAALSAAVAAGSGPAERGAFRDAADDQDGDLDAPVQFFDVHGRGPSGRPGRSRWVPRSNARRADGGQRPRNRRVTRSAQW